jgi:hypothetical protein
VAARATVPASAAVTAPCRARTRAPWAAAMAGPGRPMGRHAETASYRSRPPRPIGLRPRAGFGPSLCEFPLKSFLIVLNSRKQFKLPKFVETCRNVQKWQPKFCINPLEQLDTAGLTKLTFVQYFIVQNCKNSNTRIFVYKYLPFIMF